MHVKIEKKHDLIMSIGPISMIKKIYGSLAFVYLKNAETMVGYYMCGETLSIST